MIKDEELTVFQIVECLVTNYQYQIVNVPEQKSDMWLASTNPQAKYPIIRLNSKETESAVFEENYLLKMLQLAKMLNPNTSQILIINTNRNSKDFSENNIVQECFTTSKKNQDLIDTFPLLMQYVKVSDNNDSAVAQIKNRLGNYLTAYQKQMKKRFKKAHPKPKNSILLIVLMVISFLVYVLMASTHQNMSMNSALILTGGFYKSFIYTNYEWWRMFTAPLINGDIFQLIVSSMALYLVGSSFEQIFKKKHWYWTLFIIGSLFSGIFMYILGANEPYFGITPFIVSMFTAIIANLMSEYALKSMGVKISLIQMGLLILLQSMMGVGYTSIYAVLISALVGFGFGIYYEKGKRFVSYKIHVIISSVLLLVAGLIGCLKVYQIEPLHEKWNAEVIEVIRDDFHLNSYANKLEENLKNLAEVE